jgi:ATP-dependent helicase/nuclease subunit B
VSHEVVAFCLRHGVRRKVLIAPSRQAGYNLSNWIARFGSAWANLIVETPQSLAERLARPQLESKGLCRLSPDEAVFLIHDAIESTLSTLPAGGTSAFAPGHGLTRSVAATVEALRLSHVGPSELDSRAGSSVRRIFLARVYRRYLERIDTSRRYDVAQVFTTAASLVGESSFMRDVAMAVMDEVRLSAVAHTFLDRCRDTCIEFVRIGRPDFRVDAPADAVASRFGDIEFASPAGDAIHPAGQIRARRLALDSEHIVQIRDAVGADAEVRGVFREILLSGYPLDDVEIVYTDPGIYAARIATVADFLGVPVRFGDGLPAHLSRPGQAILGYYRWLAEGMDSRTLIHLLRSGLISFSNSTVSAMGLAEMLEAGRARDGREGHLAALDRARADLELRRTSRGQEGSQDRLALVDAQRMALDGLLNLVDDGEITVRVLADAGRRFLAEYFRHGSEREANALESVIDRLSGLERVESRGRTSALSEVLVELLRDHRVGISAANEGCVYAVPVSKGGYAGRPITFVVGLDEGSFPGGAAEDPLLPDYERRRLSPELDERLARPGARVWELLRYLGSIPGHVYLVANRFDLVDGRERYASSVFAQCREDLGIKSPPRYCPSIGPGEAITASDVWVTERDAEGYGGAVAKAFPQLAAGAEAVVRRESPLLSRYDGYLGRETPELSLTDDQVLSASKLERLAACPHRYFLKDVLGVRPIEEADEEDHHWLNPREFGSLIHEVLFDFMRGLKERGEQPDIQRHRDELKLRANEKASEARLRTPPETELAYQADVRRLLRTMDIFLSAESDAEYEQPLEFEMRFGWGSESPRYPNPVRLDLGGDLAIRLRGSIDRVDSTREGFVVWDYKTGSSGSFNRSDLFAGERLQWALYALAFRQIGDGLPADRDVVKSGYYFVGEKESGRRILQRVPDAGTVGSRIAPLAEMVRRGAFFHFQRLDKNSSPCRFCDFKAVCEKELRGTDSLKATLDSPVPAEVLGILEHWLSL